MTRGAGTDITTDDITTAVIVGEVCAASGLQNVV